MIRVPVVSQDAKPLMPTKSSRARRWVKEGKAVGKWSDVGIYYVQLLVPKGEETQPVVVGLDPGKSYAGIGVQSAQFTLARFHLILPFGRVKQRMEQRRMLRRSRRSRRINRKVSFKLRNHRQVRFNNRKQSKVPPSIKASRQLELRVVRELSKIFPLTAIVYERVKADVDRTKRKSAKSGKGFSPVMSGQNWAIAQMETIAPVLVREGWQKNGNGTSQIRKHLGLVKDKENKGEAKPETHAVDGVALACGFFVQYSRHITSNTQGYLWRGNVQITDSVFRIVTRLGAVKRGKEYGFFRRQLHFLVPDKSGIRKRKGGTVTPFGFRVGDLVKATKKEQQFVGYIGGFTCTDKSKNVSIYDYSWKRIGQFTPSKVKLLRRSNRLCLA
ncbi:RRXRR domain-containing protein [Lyngbya aestuarii]|uniref:RRXRR domain-containing protein n=1 Tax=Lyngbya aestuarii TaxID=118322 RepID=UPI00403DE8FF